jgi:hypothetical protein
MFLKVFFGGVHIEENVFCRLLLLILKKRKQMTFYLLKKWRMAAQPPLAYCGGRAATLDLLY